MKIYIAQSINLKDIAINLRNKLNVQYEVTASWIDLEETLDPLHNTALCQYYANLDLNEILNSDLVVYFSEGLSYGKNIEFGYCLGIKKPIVIIGKIKSVFHYSDNVLLRCDNDEELLAFLYENSLLIEKLNRLYK